MWTFNRSTTPPPSGYSSGRREKLVGESWMTVRVGNDEPSIPDTTTTTHHMPVYARGLFGSFPTVKQFHVDHAESVFSENSEGAKSLQDPPTTVVARKIRIVPFDELELTSSSNGSRVEYVNPEQSGEIMKQMRALRDDEQLCDVELIAEGTVIRAHRYILAAASPYFRSMFTNGMVEMKKLSIELQDVPRETLEVLIDYIYTDKIAITVTNVHQLIFTASFLQMDVIVSACQEFLSSMITPQNYLVLHELAETYNCTNLISSTDAFAADQFDCIRSRTEFNTISFHHLKRLLNRPDLNVDKEQNVFEAIVAWIDVDPPDRLQYLPQLFETVRLHLVGWNYLCQVIKTNQYVKECRECRDIIATALLDSMTPTLQKNSKKVPKCPVEENISQYSASIITSPFSTSTSKISQVKTRKSVAGIIFCAGGRGTAGGPFSSVEAYDWRTNHWFPVADMMSQRRHVGVVSANGNLYAIGGHDGTAHLATAEVFTPSGTTWKRIASMRTARRGIAVASLDSAIYAVGGLDDSTCYKTVERYDIESDEWSTVQDMKVQRGGVGVSVLGKYLFAIGGNDGTSSLDTCERYDPLIDRWVCIARMQNRRAGSGVCVLDGFLYAIGGFDDNAPLATCERYDMEADRWQSLAHMSSPRGGVGVAALGGMVYAIGGHDGSRYLNTVECYDPILNSWQEAADINECRAGAGVAWANVRMQQLDRANKCDSGCAPNSGANFCI